ncbi:hypothetical protein TRIATDRAFT_289269 [Trichoderma atroviride IMI 206040]|uniref:Uncharacterized protein n=1 Tax=Hypocrea atroviridis (strain ATCC 20476 / IMI 206040) TaxID=452589 RepID=G9NGW7_HYPAI|nr:uncharacterized protein TRIATDRAFT_289269 [Trichoderma atroviride IMI 206040]EHK49865.1 hypothetical protein TRIATDRAFT_289269 [Trichoderma atroviride IMI 206040]
MQRLGDLEGQRPITPLFSPVPVQDLHHPCFFRYLVVSTRFSTAFLVADPWISTPVWVFYGRVTQSQCRFFLWS